MHPCRQHRPRPEQAAVKSILSRRATATGRTKAQKNWKKAERAASVCAAVRHIGEAVHNANTRWAEYLLPEEPTAKLTFNPRTQRSHGEIEDDMYTAPKGILCRATADYKAGSQDELTLAAGQRVVVLRVVPKDGLAAAGPPWFEGVRCANTERCNL